jgi:hypothetical protein
MSNRPELPGSNTLGRTDALWANMPLDMMLGFNDLTHGVAMFDDFIGFGGTLSTNTGQYFSGRNRYVAYQTASYLLTNVAFTPTPASVAPTSRGAIVLGGTAAINDNDECALQWGGHELTPYGSFPFSVIPGMSDDLVFECRIKISSIAVDIGNFFIGLVGAAGVAPAATSVPITTSDALATTVSALGFGRLAAITDGAVALHYERASGTATSKAAVATAVADTYIKLGFKWDGNAKTLTPWVDGVPVPSKMISASVSGATPWPNDFMAPVMAVMQKDADTAQKLTVDWWGCAQKLRV